jgi:hypothetical protein
MKASKTRPIKGSHRANGFIFSALSKENVLKMEKF